MHQPRKLLLLLPERKGPDLIRRCAARMSGLRMRASGRENIAQRRILVAM